MRRVIGSGRIGAASARRQILVANQVVGIGGLRLCQIDNFEVRRIMVVALEQPLVVGAGPNYGDALVLRRQGQDAVVGEQDH